MNVAPRRSDPGVRTIKTDAPISRMVLVLMGAALLCGAFFSAKWGFANTAASRADTKEVAEFTTLLAPNDPQAHFSSAVTLEKSFEQSDLEQALIEYETATALAPHNYYLWLELGRARERAGDSGGAEAALRRAQELAPHYASVQWALGNLLVRQGRTEEGFTEIRRAVASNPAYTNSAALTAWQILDGDMERVRAAIGNSAIMNASLAAFLAGQKRFEEAMQIWNSVPPAEKPALQEQGTIVLRHFTAAKRYRDAAKLSSELAGSDVYQPARITNGGFESEIKTANAAPFDWQVGPGAQPQIAPTSGQKRGGSVSLVLIFNASETKDFRDVSQTVPVQPGAEYVFEIFYKAELKTAALFKWQISGAADGRGLGTTDAVENTDEWKPLRVRFRVPEDSDGVIVGLIRQNCGNVLCPAAGNLWFDDAALRPIN